MDGMRSADEDDIARRLFTTPTGVACAEAVEQTQKVSAAVVEAHLPHVGPGVYRAVFFSAASGF